MSEALKGKILYSPYAREKIPYLGICLGMQVAVIEFARNMAGMADAHSTEFTTKSTHPVIGLITEWTDASGAVETRSKKSQTWGYHAFGAQSVSLWRVTGAQVLRENRIVERHRHRYEVNNNLLPKLVEAGLVVSGTSLDGELVEMIEVKDHHPWFVVCQFHPEFTSTPRDGHGLFQGFVRAATQNSIKSSK